MKKQPRIIEIPRECACGVCGKWGEPRGWDGHLEDFACQECLTLLQDANDKLNAAGIVTLPIEKVIFKEKP